jgi:hypothetical protein
MRAREKEVREREARERLVRERVAKEKEMKERLEKEIREKMEKEQAEKDAQAQKEKAEKEAQAQKEKAEKEALAQKEKAEKEAQEQIERAEKEAQEQKEKAEKEAQAQKEKAQKEAQAHKEKTEREARVQAARERLEKAKLEAVPKSIFGVGERTNPYSLDNKSTAPTPAAMAAAAAAAAAAANPAPTSTRYGPGALSEKKPAYERPTAQSYVGTSTETAYRPYDKARPKHTSGSSFYSTYSDSYAPSQSTAPSSAPPSRRGPYSTSDPDKVVIQAVYSFSDNFPKPTASLVAGEDGCTDGTVLRITTEGMFVDDDIKGIGMREWDLKAWTMKSVEVSASFSFPLDRLSC